MHPMNSDTCDTCDQEYAFIPQNEGFRVYIVGDAVDLHHIIATCPNCGAVERIFCTWEVILHNINLGLKISVHSETEDLRAQRNNCYEDTLVRLELKEAVRAFHDEVEHIEDHLGEL